MSNIYLLTKPKSISYYTATQISSYHGFLLGSLIFLLITGGDILWPTHINWLLKGDDVSQNWLGWQFFRRAPLLQWPLGANPYYGLGLNNSIVFTDSIPLLALFFKFFDLWLPKYFQYQGMWLLSCFMLQGHFAQKLLSLITKDKLLQSISTLFFLLSPILLFRINRHHALSAQWMLLAAIYFYFSSDFKRNGWLFLLNFAVLVHFYLFTMALGLWAVDLIKKNKAYSSITITRHLIFLCASVFFLMWISGYFIISINTIRPDYNILGMNLLSLINPQDWSSVLPNQSLPFIGQSWEGFNFLGLGMLCLFPITLLMGLKNRLIVDNLVVRHRALLIMCLIFSIYAISTTVAFGPVRLFDYYSIFNPLIIFYTKFRAAGRFFWPVYYLMYCFIFYVIIKNFSKRVSLMIISLFLIVQVMDSFPKLIEIRQSFLKPNYSYSLDNHKWENLGGKYDKLLYTRIIKGMNPDWFNLSYFAEQHNMSINGGYINTLDSYRVVSLNNRLLKVINTNAYQANTLYIFTDNKLWNLAKSKHPEGEFMVLDGIKVFAPA